MGWSFLEMGYSVLRVTACLTCLPASAPCNTQKKKIRHQMQASGQLKACLKLDCGLYNFSNEIRVVGSRATGLSRMARASASITSLRSLLSSHQPSLPPCVGSAAVCVIADFVTTDVEKYRLR